MVEDHRNQCGGCVVVQWDRQSQHDRPEVGCQGAAWPPGPATGRRQAMELHVWTLM